MGTTHLESKMADKAMEKDYGAFKDKSSKQKGLLSECLATYKYLLRTRPVLTKSVTCAVTSGLGQLISQKLRGTSDGKGLNFRSIAAFSTFGFAITGPFVHYFYQALEHFIPKGTSHATIKKLALDRIIFSPIFYALFFYVITLLEGQSSKAAVKKVQDNFWTAFKMSLKIWTLFQYVNFNYIPLEYRLLFANLFALGWNVYMATKNAGK
ncbi:peroxisomal membrane protein 2 [Exaiptasia diaphana]|uniref:Peroxisomal membrane protein 2 n=1 Tax=Exaiptasia diaphana TaxID=2652724 RepID=A0A913WVC1_EXADI|nr:peroxisomal membrane protein 2 [Exaiptasia diaphana]